MSKCWCWFICKLGICLKVPTSIHNFLQIMNLTRICYLHNTFLYTSEHPTIVIGKSQTTLEERSVLFMLGGIKPDVLNQSSDWIHPRATWVQWIEIGQHYAGSLNIHHVIYNNRISFKWGFIKPDVWRFLHPFTFHTSANHFSEAERIDYVMVHQVGILNIYHLI